MQKLRERLEDLRTAMDLSQIKIANNIQITQQQYSKYETGASEVPLTVLVDLANFHQVSTDYLLGRIDCRYSNHILVDEAVPGMTLGAVLELFITLSPYSRAAVIEQIEMRALKEKAMQMPSKR